jgi:hypothetical protein
MKSASVHVFGSEHRFARISTYTLSIRAVRARRPEVLGLCVTGLSHCECCGMPGVAAKESGS